MTKTVMLAIGAAILLAGPPQIASASCLGDVAASRMECLRDAGRDRGRVGECNALYRDDLAECHSYGHGPMPMHSPPPPPMRR
jgi:hypothetical protein